MAAKGSERRWKRKAKALSRAPLADRDKCLRRGQPAAAAAAAQPGGGQPDHGRAELTGAVQRPPGGRPVVELGPVGGLGDELEGVIPERGDHHLEPRQAVHFERQMLRQRRAAHGRQLLQHDTVGTFDVDLDVVRRPGGRGKMLPIPKRSKKAVKGQGKASKSQ